MEWVCEQHQKGKYLYTNACCSQVIGLPRASSSSSSVEQESSPTVLSSAGLGMSGTHSCCPQDYVQLKNFTMTQLKLFTWVHGPTGWRGQPVVRG